MKFSGLTTAAISRRQARARLSLGTAVAGTLAILAMPGVAHAQNECGVAPVGGGTVTCDSSGNPYDNGITYVAPGGDLTIEIEDGVVIDTTGNLNPGILALTIGDDAVTINGGTGTSIITDASGAYGALVATNDGALTVNLDEITTSGANATGILASSATGATTVTANRIQTSGLRANGIEANTNSGDIDVDAGTIITSGAGANGISARSDFADISIAVDSVTTSGGQSGFLNPGANGVLAITGGPGTISVDAGTINTAGLGGIGIRTQTNTGMNTIVVDSITTAGNNAHGISATATNGMIDIDAGTITTSGTGANGILASGRNGVTIAFDSITTSGANSVGVLIPAGSLFGPIPTNTVSITGGDITTSGANADGIRALVGTGNVEMDLSGTITTTGANARGIFVTTAGDITIVGGGNVSTAGDDTNAVDVASTAGDIFVEVGDVSTAGDRSRAISAIGSVDGDVTIIADAVSTTGIEGSGFFFLPSSTGIFARGSGTGDVSIVADSVSTLGFGARGIDAAAAAGDVTIAVGDVTTDGDNAVAVAADTVSGNIAVLAGDIVTGGDNATGVLATSSTGAIDIATGNISTLGFNADGINVTTAGDVSITHGAISTAGTFAEGISASTSVGDIDIVGGSITATGDATTALFAGSTDGNVSINNSGTIAATGRGGSGVFATSTNGDVTVDVTNVTTVATLPGDVTTSRSAIFASGANTNVIARGTVSTAGIAEFGGTFDAIVANATAGDVSVTANNVLATGAGSRAIFATATDAAFVTVNGNVRSTGAGADAVVIEGETAQVVVGPGGTVSSAGGDAIQITSTTSSRVINNGTIAAQANGFAINALGGPIIIDNNGTLSSDIRLTAGADRVNNNGTFLVTTNADFGAGNDVFANAGTVRLATGATAPVSFTFTGLEAFNNTGGLVDLRNGVAGDQLTTPGTFAGSGNSRLGLDIQYGSAITADRLNIGGAASGSTTVLLNTLGTGPAQFSPGTILVQAGAASSANAFVLGANGFVEQGFVRQAIVYDPTTFAFRLTGAPSDAAFRTLNFVEGARNLWLKSADVVSGQLRAQRDALWSMDGGEPSPRLWVQIHGSVETRETSRSLGAVGQVRTVNTGFEQDYFGGQIGLDLGGGSGERGGFAFGVTGGYINSSMNFAGSADRLQFDAVNAGVYASYSSGNFFVNALGKYDYYWADAVSPSAGFNQDFNGDSWGARGEAGIRFGNDSFFVEPAASISWVNTSFDDFNVLGTGVSFEDENGLRGRLGARVGGQFGLFGSEASFYLGGNYVREFEGRDEVVFTGGGQTFTFENERPRDYGEALLGVSVGQSNGVSGFIEGQYIRSFKDRAGGTPIEGAGGRAGLRVRF